MSLYLSPSNAKPSSLVSLETRKTWKSLLRITTKHTSLICNNVFTQILYSLWVSITHQTYLQGLQKWLKNYLNFIASTENMPRSWNSSLKRERHQSIFLLWDHLDPESLFDPNLSSFAVTMCIKKVSTKVRHKTWWLHTNLLFVSKQTKTSVSKLLDF